MNYFCSPFSILWRGSPLRKLSILALFFLVLAAGGTCLSQGLSRPKSVRLRVIVNYQGGHAKVQYASVEIMDAVGGSSAMDKKITDQDGRVEFDTITGGHRIRVTGSDFQPFEGSFEITPAERFHTENVSVRSKSRGETPGPEPMGTVPAIRLKIPDNARKEFEKGTKTMEEQKWSESRRHFQAAVDLYPDYDLAYNGLGSACWQLNDIPSARQAFLKATELNDKFPEAQRNLARILLPEHEYEEVALLLNRSLDAEPMNAWALTNTAYAELQLHRFKEAAAHALRVHGLPHDGLANAHVIAGYALEALGQQHEAAEQWGLYLKEDPKGPNAKRAQEAVARLSNSPLS